MKRSDAYIIFVENWFYDNTKEYLIDGCFFKKKFTNEHALVELQIILPSHKISNLILFIEFFENEIEINYIDRIELIESFENIKTFKPELEIFKFDTFKVFKDFIKINNLLEKNNLTLKLKIFIYSFVSKTIQDEIYKDGNSNVVEFVTFLNKLNTHILMKFE